MKPIYDAWLIQIEVTNACHLRCAHCSRGVRHIAKPFYMELDYVEKALQSLSDWPKGVGCMGGEPTLHPDFESICNLYRKYVPRHKAGLWTSGGPKFKRYENLIRDTFGILLYNDHSEVGKHQPLMVAIEECVPDKDLREELLDNCWLQKLWSPAITPKGAFFCECAAVFDFLFDGPGGYPLDNGWWKKNPSDFQDQREKYCRYCSISVPFPTVATDCEVDYVSAKNLKRLREAGSPWINKGKVVVVDDEFTRKDIEKTLSAFEYAPWEYLGEKGIRSKNDKVGRGYARKRKHSPLSVTKS